VSTIRIAALSGSALVAAIIHSREEGTTHVAHA
jgi:hypothetical protein